MFDDPTAVDFGLGYAIAGAISDADRTIDINVNITQSQEHEPVLINALESAQEIGAGDWDDYVGQEALKTELQVALLSARRRKAAMPHVLLASGMPGVGKTTMARLVAQEMGSPIIMLSPPFHDSTLHKAVMSLPDFGILFIDEIHKMADGGARKAESLLHILEDKTLHLDTGLVTLNDITVIGATTDAEKLPEAVLDRFPLKPEFVEYTEEELVLIGATFRGVFGSNINLDVLRGIAKACRKTPRVVRDMVQTARDLEIVLGHPPTIDELLRHMRIESDGMTLQHIRYLTTLLRFPRVIEEETHYVAGENTMMTVMRLKKEGLWRIERFLMEQGLLERTHMGRRLTPAGISKAEAYILEGKG